MRLEGRNPALVFFSVCSVCATFLAFSGCQDSKSVTGPSTTTMTTPAAKIAGAWNGTFQSYESKTCGNSSASATFQQDGNTITGFLRTSDCGVAGSFKGTIQGNSLTGLIDMTGCVGGGVSGTVNGSQISLIVGDLTKPLITGDRVLMTGGAVNLSR